MVERPPNVPYEPGDAELDATFGALTRPTRRELIEQLAGGPKSVSELAEPHDVSLAAVSKRLQVSRMRGLSRSRRTDAYAGVIWTRLRFRLPSDG